MLSISRVFAHRTALSRYLLDTDGEAAASVLCASLRTNDEHTRNQPKTITVLKAFVLMVNRKAFFDAPFCPTESEVEQTYSADTRQTLGTQPYFAIALFYWDNRNYTWHAFVLPVKLIRRFSFTDAVSAGLVRLSLLGSSEFPRLWLSWHKTCHTNLLHNWQQRHRQYARCRVDSSHRKGHAGLG